MGFRYCLTRSILGEPVQDGTMRTLMKFHGGIEVYQVANVTIFLTRLRRSFVRVSHVLI